MYNYLDIHKVSQLVYTLWISKVYTSVVVGNVAVVSEIDKRLYLKYQQRNRRPSQENRRTSQDLRDSDSIL